MVDSVGKWKSLFNSLCKFSDEFMAKREQSKQQDREDVCAYDKAKSRPSHPIPFGVAVKKLKDRKRNI